MDGVASLLACAGTLRTVAPRWNAPHASDTERFDPESVFEAGLLNHHIANTAYPIAHESTWQPYRVAGDLATDSTRRAWRDIRELGLYVHVPFCETRCSFCEYTVTKRSEHDGVDAYMSAVLDELTLYQDLFGGCASGSEARTLVGLDIGGGTPSFVPADHISRVVDRIAGSFRFSQDADISIETTPAIAASDLEKLMAYRRAGIDRISMGVQVIQPDLLRTLNREANGVESHHRAVEHIRRAGFDRLNVDLMYGFKDQSLESWQATIDHTLRLEPEYITLYRMRYKLTRISHQAPFVELEQVQALAELAKRALADAGYQATAGKTTFSKIPGDVGTSSYLARRVVEGVPYLGVGLGAQSFTHTSIAYNAGAAGKNLAPYLRSVAAGKLPIQDFYDLPATHMMAKMCAVSFYFGEIHLESFERKFGMTLEAAYPDAVDFVLCERLMEWTETGTLRLTGRGARLKSGVHALFYAPSVQAYLLERDPAHAKDMERHRRRADKQ